MVVGWYADPASDILAPARQPAGLAARLAELGWSAGPDPAGRVAGTTVCHGAIRALTYSRTFTAPRPAPAALAVGNTSVDAVSALIRERAARQPDAGLDPDLLEAFQYDLLHTLDDPDGPALLATRIHDAWFTARPGGSVWQVVAAQPDGDGPPAEPSTADPDWLAELNGAQARYDLAARRLAALQRELYELWWKRGRYNALQYRPEGLTDARSPRSSTPAGRRAWPAASRRCAGRSSGPGRTCRGVPRSRSWRPRWTPTPRGTRCPAHRAQARRPAVVPQRGRPGGGDRGVRAGTFDENFGAGADGLLPCRFADQLITTLTLPLGGPDGRLPDGSAPGPTPPSGVQIPVHASDIAGAPGIVPLTGQHGGVPVAAAFVALQAEAYLLDPAHAVEVAGGAARGDGRADHRRRAAHGGRVRRDRDPAGDPAAALATGLSIAELIGGGGVAMPMVDGPVTYGPPEPGGFQALRAGQFAFAQVRVVDRFGQSIDVYDISLARALTPTIAEGLVPQQSIGTGVATFIQLPPRLLEPARLDVGFAPTGPGRPSRPGEDASAAADVVCAWIVPSPLDEAVACYAPDGAALGELTETAGLTGPQISWLPAPDSTCPTSTRSPGPSRCWPASCAA